MRWWGWGEDSGAITLPEPALALLRDELGMDGSAAGGAGASWTRSALPAPALPEARARARWTAAGAERRARRPHRASRTPPGAATRTWCASAPATARHAPDAVVHARRPPARWPAVLAACAQAGRGGDPVRRRHQRGGRGGGAARRPRGRDLARPDRGWTALLDVDPRLAHRHAWSRACSGPSWSAALGAAGPDARPLPAVVRVLDRRRLGGHPLGRPGLDRLRAHRRAGRGGALRDARRARWRPATCPPPPPGPSLRELVVGSEGVLGVITAGHAARAPAAARRATTRPGRSAPSRRAPRRYRRLEQAGALARRRPPLRRGRDPRCRWRWPPAASTAERAGRAYLRLRGHEDGCLAFTGFEGTPDDVARRRGRAAGMLRAAGARVAGPEPGPLVAARAASPRPTCATSCWTAA